MRAPLLAFCLTALASTACAVDDQPIPAPVGEADSRHPWSVTGYRLIGTEPFWGGSVTSREIVYSTPEDPDGQAIAVTARLEGGREIYSGSRGGRPFILVLTQGPCSDGMSDNVHHFTATLEVDGEVRRGCANPA